MMFTLDEQRIGMPIGPAVRPWARRGDRRPGVAALVAALASHVRASRDASTLRARFETVAGEVLRLAAVRLRECLAPSAAVSLTARKRSDVLSYDVPTRAGSPRMVLEASIGPETRPDEWTLQALAMASQLAALVVELDRPRSGDLAWPAWVTRRPGQTTPPLVGSSPAMICLREHIARVAATDFTVLIQGESGTGKEMVARQIHESSRRRHGSFIAVNCAAIVESLLEAELFGIEDRTATGVRGRRGKFEHADGGTLFLDEVSDLAPSAQAKLLRAIQELTVERVGGHASRKVDTRIVVATNKSLRDYAARGLFREDLYYRLSGVELHVPPLRSRRNDIAELCEHFLSRYERAQPLTFSPDATEAMRIYDWPGNVRELERLIEGAVTLAGTDSITLRDLPPALRGDCGDIFLSSLLRNDSMRAWGARYARLVLDRCRDNKRQACRLLGISYHTLQAYLAFGLGAAATKPGETPSSGSEDPSGEATDDSGLDVEAQEETVDGGST